MSFSADGSGMDASEREMAPSFGLGGGDGDSTSAGGGGFSGEASAGGAEAGASVGGRWEKNPTTFSSMVVPKRPVTLYVVL